MKKALGWTAALVVIGGLVFLVAWGIAMVYHPAPANDGGTVYCGHAEDDCTPVYQGDGRWEIRPTAH